VSDTITLPRAVVEEVRSAIRVFYNKYSAEAAHKNAGRALAALDAALAEPEPTVKDSLTVDATREPATDGQIFDAYQSAPEDNFYWGWDAAERFHGIRKEDKP
jgi:hypothetical protein